MVGRKILNLVIRYNFYLPFLIVISGGRAGPQAGIPASGLTAIGEYKKRRNPREEMSG